MRASTTLAAGRPGPRGRQAFHMCKPSIGRPAYRPPIRGRRRGTN